MEHPGRRVRRGITVLAFSLLIVLPIFSQDEEIELRVMTFNIWYGGEQVSFSQTVRVLQAADPDLVAIQEPDGNLKQLADAAGFSYVDLKRNILSRYPLFDPDTSESQYLYTRVLVRPGKIVAFANTHLASTPFGPDLIREGKTPDEVLANEMQIRVPEVAPYAKALADVIARGIPVFFAGDFNSPSHLDWTQDVAAKAWIPFPFQWPVTRILADAGLRDSYREAHPDPVQKPGFTWTPGYPHPWVKSDEMHARIDMIWSGGKTSTLTSAIVGEAGNPEVDASMKLYPSDHRAVVSTFRIVPAMTPALIAIDTPSFVEGNDFVVRFQTPDFSDWGVAIIPHGGTPSKDVIVATAGPNVISTRPSIKFGSRGFQPGTYDAVLLDAKSRELVRTEFQVLAKNAVPELRVEKENYKKGESIRAFFRNAPGMKNDWIGIYRANDPDLYGGYLAFVYTGARIEGSVLFEPQKPGEYELRLMRDDSYVMLARSRFIVSEE